MSWQVADGMFLETIDGEMIVLDSAGNRYLALNETGAAIVAAVEEGCSLDAIAERLANGWDVDPSEASTFALKFLDDLCGRGVLDRT